MDEELRCFKIIKNYLLNHNDKNSIGYAVAFLIYKEKVKQYGSNEVQMVIPEGFVRALDFCNKYELPKSSMNKYLRENIQSLNGIAIHMPGAGHGQYYFNPEKLFNHMSNNGNSNRIVNISKRCILMMKLATENNRKNIYETK